MKYRVTIGLVFLAIGLIAIGYVLQVHIFLLSLYGLLSVGRILFQAITADRVRNQNYKPLADYPFASIIVATYNEDPKLLNKAMESLAAQDYPNYEVIVVDDGSRNPQLNRRIVEHYGHQYIHQANAGKRHAMYNAFGRLNPYSQVVLTADGDTVWQPNAATELVKALLADPYNGAVTGYVGVINAKTNWLTRICDQRYWMAFNIERASQSLFGTVTCVSGPLGAYRRRLIDQVKDQFITQAFLGKSCTFGDDRHLTNLILGLGYRVRYNAQAVCLSDCPTSLLTYLKQQTRWGKSHWREMLWQLKALDKQSLYLSFDWIVTLLMPFLLVMSLLRYLYLSVMVSPRWIVYLLTMLVVMSVIRVIPAMLATRSLKFIWFVGFTFINLFLLLPLKFWALVTINRTAWGTRPAA